MYLRGPFIGPAPRGAASVEYLRMLRGGWRNPSKKMARAISATADGDVSVAELLTYERPARVKEPRRAKHRAAAS
jgi:hypothetical protein